MVHYLRTLLAPYYRVLGCFDAREALQLIDEEAPDLVLSDVVLPGMNGYAFCRRIKEDAQLCHIPVVLVTAKTDVEDKVEGLDTGADAYVTKPFEPSYLLALVKSQLRKSERVRRLLGQSTQTTRIEEDLLAPQDKAFMTELYRLMETELSNPEFDIACATEAQVLLQDQGPYRREPQRLFQDLQAQPSSRTDSGRALYDFGDRRHDRFFHLVPLLEKFQEAVRTGSQRIPRLKE